MFGSVTDCEGGPCRVSLALEGCLYILRRFPICSFSDETLGISVHLFFSGPAEV